MIRFETFERLTLRGRRYFFRLVVVGNSEIIAQSEAYNSARARDHAIRLIRHGAFEARVIEGTRS
ncbi:MAG TPA: YegP family protein [Xanthobacteraceae bacterium]|nr:YegP family protein [Xanthobacteraceae bacterium]